MNVVILMGRMTRDPELKYTSGGKAFANFSLAVQKTKDEVEFIDCTAWEKTAETIAEYFRKGNRILIQGRLSVSNYEQNGEKRKSTKVVVNSFEFVESSGTSGNNGGYQQQQSFSNNTKKPVSVQNDTYEDDNDDMDDDEEFPF
ncbi:single-stranded DNA-binding protein [Leptotrichia buccalis]|uniref:Single-stranded DNA-binding protein n=1 Tax=Leptotrichia buccalis (strain ATCC 14201 / DSM 1135 / JCM 12969 / NCTC 10249 / C-1013-b) TaxID=523794 RepID=C7NDG9_LEPBD|nr:single-stranded DNA-binding protein [Leptotrichia buccalis]ACV38131.1 single-strand binding protein [Leptotrichia buccalis C-1013-b]